MLLRGCRISHHASIKELFILNSVRSTTSIAPRGALSANVDIQNVTGDRNCSKAAIPLPSHHEPKSTLSLKFHVETYGCQMNLSDTEIVRSILKSAGHTETASVDDAEIIFQNTCAIRENAEAKIWNRLKYFKGMRRRSKRKGYPKVGVLGCMAERLKEKLFEDEAVDLVCGPDAYRDLPRLLDSVLSSDQKEANTQLSFEETYADINPVRVAQSGSAFGKHLSSADIILHHNSGTNHRVFECQFRSCEVATICAVSVWFLSREEESALEMQRAS